MKEITLEVNSSITDVSSVTQFLANYDRAIQVYEGDFKADWLLTDIHADIWIMKTPKTIKKYIKKNGDFDDASTHPFSYKYTHNVRWDRILPDETLLTDKNNREFLELVQKLVFITYESPYLNGKSNLTGLFTMCSPLLMFISWMYLHKEVFNPSSFGFSKLTNNYLESFIKDAAKGGSFSVLKTGERIINKINSISRCSISNKDIFSLTKIEKDSIIEFFEINCCYKKNNYGVHVIDRVKIRDLFNISKQELKPSSCTLFLRQFEPEVLSVNDKLLLPLHLKNELPSHKTSLMSDTIDKTYGESLSSGALSCLVDFMKLKQMFPSKLPKPEVIQTKKLFNLINKECDYGNVTPWIPLPISLKLLNRSIGFIVNYGEDLLNFYDELSTELIKIDGYRTDRNFFPIRCAIITSMIPDKLKNFNISKLGQKKHSGVKTRVQNLRKNPSVHEVLKVLLGACLVIIAGLKPIRAGELSALKYDCLFFKDGDGFWISQQLEKSGKNGILPSTEKPIPKISAKAIQLLQRFNDISQKIVKNVNKKESEYLLYGINLTGSYREGSVKSAQDIHNLMAVFCDYIELEPDEYGRRWYVNVHELRKSFLLTFFWTFKFSSLDACRWIAGHKDPDHVLKYIEANIPGEEMIEVESEYAYQQIRLFYEGSSLPEMKNIESLNDDVCNHFNVNNISEVPEDDLKDWINLAIAKGIYKIEVFGIDSLDEEINTEVAFRLRDADS
ncbi:hypothetical protein NX722_18260 [Endozoicomonas gorgoniicola]|uniref:Integrase n=1 Tax=Endozoicomonas gorgoniicola TaxID=1234144 RepID=A0ABT3MYT0_9GAMM|nr:hypothetical protein [Endozoicomonas gorgoniicola]MCW7554531.1 hypothetical protein [Endozoicomonas gorgoniicola]